MVISNLDHTQLGKAQPEYEEGSGESWVGEDVEDSEAEEGEDVLHVVQVGSSHSFNILVHSRLVWKKKVRDVSLPCVV